MTFNRWVRLLAVIFIIVAASLVYSNSLHSEFQLDDQSTITTNKSIRSLNSAILTPHPRPVVNFSLALNYHFSELETFGYHLTNLIIHILSAILIFFVIELTLKLPLLKERFGDISLRIATLAALIFAVHPVHTESVTYLTSRTECLASMFYLLALFLFILSIRHSRYKILYYLGAIVSTLLAMGSKEIAATIPVLILLYDFMLVSGQNLKELKKRWPFHAFMFSTLIFPVYLIVRNIDVYGKTAGFGIPYVRPLNYLFTQFSVVLYYIKLILLPFPLNLDYDWPYAKGLFEFPTILSFLVLITIFVLTVKLFNHKPLYTLLIIWYFLILSPSSSIIPIKDVVFEHRIYLASVGIIWLFLLGIVPFLRSKTILFRVISLRYLCMTLILLLVPVFGRLTLQRNIIWQTEISLWEDVVRKSPNRARPHHNLGRAYHNKGILDKAIKQYHKAIERDPYHVKSFYHLGTIYAKQGLLDKAALYLQKAIKINPEYAIAHNDLGVVYAEQGLLGKAILQLKKATQIDPNCANAYYNLGMIYEKLGHLDEAMAYYQKTIQIDPRCREAHYSLRILNEGQDLLKEGPDAEE